VESLKGFDLISKDLFRPAWDKYFLRLADLVSTRSNCMKRAVGAVVVQDFRIISTGYNGTPVGALNCNEGGCDRCNAGTASGVGLDECLCIHAEENAIIEAGRQKTSGGTIYITTFPCLICAKTLVQSGLRRIVYNREYSMPSSLQFLKSIPHIEIVQITP